MANPNFVPDFSTNQIFRDLDQNRCLTDDLDDIDDSLAALESGKADSSHTHTGYAAASHDHTNYAPVSHEHSGYAISDHTHTGYAPASHTHTEYAIAEHGHTDYAPVSHEHTEYAATSHEHSEYAETTHTHDDYALTTHEHSDYAPQAHTHDGFALTDHAHTYYAPVSHTHDYADLNYPPMIAGTEYLTNEMWNGERLYTVLIDCGNFSDGTNVDTEFTCRYVVRNCGRIGWSCLPFIHYTLENAYSCWVEVSNFNGRIRVTMQGGTSVGEKPVQVQVWYTKPTN